MKMSYISWDIEEKKFCDFRKLTICKSVCARQSVGCGCAAPRGTKTILAVSATKRRPGVRAPH